MWTAIGLGTVMLALIGVFLIFIPFRMLNQLTNRERKRPQVWPSAKSLAAERKEYKELVRKRDAIALALRLEESEELEKRLEELNREIAARDQLDRLSR